MKILYSNPLLLPYTYSLSSIDWKKEWQNSRSWSTHFSENVVLLSFSRNSLQKPSLDNILLGHFTLWNSIILVKDRIKSKMHFEIYFADHYACDIGDKNIVGNN